MLNYIINNIEVFFNTYGAWAVFLGGVIEQIIVPLPASLIVLTSSVITLKGVDLSVSSLGVLISNSVIPASLGITIGSLVFYIIAYKAGIPFIERIGPYMGFGAEDVQEVENKFKESRYEHLFIFMARCLPIIPSVSVNIFCGLIKYNPRDYVIITFLGTTVQIFFWGLLGWFSGNIYLLVKAQISFIDNLVTAIIVLVILYFILKKNRAKIKI
ncbi:MAG: VTT domain-containing protein [Euryarchaeota archaeon]|nr:VTT domain-containing protein [Euryarchaeota archaeon]MBU4608758.1 VTT domain-containing protein [Euryarchaeota archaeon]MBV1728830.1 VTT domain-containing protein [Methanobacterium sp.]MBV1755215.1 VTT domain-containing protein [Methanobacterium sp.]